MNRKLRLIYCFPSLTLDECEFICSVEKSKGPGELKKIPRGLHDPGLFLGNNGRIDVAYGYENNFYNRIG